MRLAIVSDIHGSLAALEAVVADIKTAGVDRVVHGGDLALTGPRPAEVVDLVRELNWDGVVGNTDQLLWNPGAKTEQEAKAPKLKPLLSVLFEDLAPATLERLGEERLRWLQGLPLEWKGDGIRLVHASPKDLWRASMPEASDEEFENTYATENVSLVVYCHIHRPFLRRIGGWTIANSGSAGLSYDGDSRASYLVIEDGTPEIRRVEYDLERDIADLNSTGYPHAAWLEKIKRSGRYQPPV